jgi:hypothetical protein
MLPGRLSACILEKLNQNGLTSLGPRKVNYFVDGSFLYYAIPNLIFEVKYFGVEMFPGRILACILEKLNHNGLTSLRAQKPEP